jgi:hypothetical protein
MVHTPLWLRSFAATCITVAGLTVAIDLLPSRTDRPSPIAPYTAHTIDPPPLRSRLDLPPVVAWQRWFRHRLAAQLIAQFLHAQPPIAEWSDRAYLVVNLRLRRVYLFDRGLPVGSYRVGIGQPGWETPIGSFTITRKLKHPVWRHPLTEIEIQPSEANPLGDRWIEFWVTDQGAIGFHGTNQLASVGQAVSHGCLRLSNSDVRELYDWVREGTSVRVVAQ